ncbi:Ribosomal RNA large subunit methyltransferase H [Commensalibacter sp. Nvir]|uniref:23S rRNA (pseudouridine(1915)-N(3))-methyltransferase RlmH n=1 Tax=Commensalibacter sp. Nvir TaxID=3069817 RepID=UPI002D69DFDE|nr:Ribosomal RNA large subunit methyltransferase H [Commensalibacter sp. Nvir]
MITIVAIGKMRQKAELELYNRYIKRFKPKLNLIEILEEKGNSTEVRLKEAQMMLTKIIKRSVVVSLDQAGVNLSSLTFADNLNRWGYQTNSVVFLIGGAEGLHRLAIERSNFILSFGNLTWPHMLARIMLVEQLYRAQTILQSHPYHRENRP